MPLEENCAWALGQSLFVLPYYGNGWHREDPISETWEQKDMIGPKSFNLIVEAFLKLDERVIGIRGKITERGHEYDGYWCLACLRSIDESNFSDRPGHYMIWISSNELPFSPAAEKAIYEYVTPDKSALCLCGYGTIAESPNRVQRYVETATNTRKEIEKKST